MSNYFFAWISIILMLLLEAKFFLRKGAQKKWKGKNYFLKINKMMKKLHIPMGIALIITGLVHGILSSASVLSVNAGTLCWFFAVLLGINYVARKKMNRLKPWIVFHRFLSAAMIILGIWHVISMGGNKMFRASSAQKRVRYYSDSTAKLEDGDYTGTADGYKGSVTVSVTISEGMIIDIKITSINDDYKYYSRAEQIIVESILDKQTADVDTVSGATYSSEGIINAVKDALITAEGGEEVIKEDPQKNSESLKRNRKTKNSH